MNRWTRSLAPLVCAIAFLSTGCMSVTERSHSIQQNGVAKKSNSTVFLWAGGLHRPEEIQFLRDSLPLRTVMRQEEGAEYSLEVIVHHTAVKRHWTLIPAILTLAIFPSKEEVTFNVAALLKSNRSQKVRKYFYQGRVQYWLSSLPVFWEYVGDTGGPSSDLVKAMLQSLSQDIEKDLASGQI